MVINKKKKCLTCFVPSFLVKSCVQSQQLWNLYIGVYLCVFVCVRLPIPPYLFCISLSQCSHTILKNFVFWSKMQTWLEYRQVHKHTHTHTHTHTKTHCCRIYSGLFLRIMGYALCSCLLCLMSFEVHWHFVERYMIMCVRAHTHTHTHTHTDKHCASVRVSVCSLASFTGLQIKGSVVDRLPLSSPTILRFFQCLQKLFQIQIQRCLSCCNQQYHII